MVYKIVVLQCPISVDNQCGASSGGERLCPGICRVVGGTGHPRTTSSLPQFFVFVWALQPRWGGLTTMWRLSSGRELAKSPEGRRWIDPSDYVPVQQNQDDSQLGMSCRRGKAFEDFKCSLLLSWIECFRTHKDLFEGAGTVTGGRWRALSGSGLTCTWRIFNNRAHCWEEKIANTTWTKKRPHVLQAAAAAAAAAAESSAS